MATYHPYEDECDNPLGELAEFLKSVHKHGMAFMLITRNAKGFWHMTNNDILSVGLLDETNKVSIRLAPQILTDQFREDLQRETQNLRHLMTELYGIRYSEDSEQQNQVHVETDKVVSDP